MDKTWEKHYEILHPLLISCNSGTPITWDYTMGRIVVHDENVWNERLKANAKLAPYRRRIVIENWDDICTLFSQERADGQGGKNLLLHEGPVVQRSCGRRDGGRQRTATAAPKRAAPTGRRREVFGRESVRVDKYVCVRVCELRGGRGSDGAAVGGDDNLETSSSGGRWLRVSGGTTSREFRSGRERWRRRRGNRE
ncbi:hypothetical protein AAHA92_00844 [Salvia divinorum]|uniref:Uncharacterized protein n=1 Tax=Salvia divinorum TaxID=28513 RepID=A0ABD1INA7_SALDI